MKSEHRLAVVVGNTHIRFGVFPTSPPSLGLRAPLRVEKISHHSVNSAAGVTRLPDREIALLLRERVLPELIGYHPSQAIVMSVVPSLNPVITAGIEEGLGIPVRNLVAEDFADLNLVYTPPGGMGLDRLGKIKAARILFPDESILILDFGTALTVDLLDRESYRGGMILPGYTLSFASLHVHTEQLPLLTPTPMPDFLSASTVGGITGGIYHLYHLGVSEIVKKAMLEFSKDGGKAIRLLVTGGDSVYFKDLPHHPQFIEEFNLIAANILAEVCHV